MLHVAGPLKYKSCLAQLKLINGKHMCLWEGKFCSFCYSPLLWRIKLIKKSEEADYLGGTISRFIFGRASF